MTDTEGKVRRELDRLFSAMDSGQSIPDLMRADEAASGYVVVRPGEVDWLRAAEWSRNSVVSIDKRRVRLVLIEAAKPGSGAFMRLIGRICAAGLKPIVIAPTREFQAALQRRGWRQQIVGSGFELEDRWHPAGRAALSPEREGG